MAILYVIFLFNFFPLASFFASTIKLVSFGMPQKTHLDGVIIDKELSEEILILTLGRLLLLIIALLCHGFCRRPILVPPFCEIKNIFGTSGLTILFCIVRQISKLHINFLFVLNSNGVSLLTCSNIYVVARSFSICAIASLLIPKLGFGVARPSTMVKPLVRLDRLLRNTA